MKTFAFLGILALSLSVRAADQPKSAEAKDSRQLLQEGLFEEEANRDLSKAAADYSAVLQQYEAKRSLAATALFRLAEIRSKQGNKAEAVTLFQRLLAEFPSDENLTKLSRERLAALGAPAAVASKPTPEITDGEAQELIRLRKILKDSPDAFSDGTPLDHAADQDWLQAATFLLENHAEITPRAMRLAAEGGHRGMVELLLAHGIDINLADKDGSTALHGACIGGRLQIVSLLLDKGANPNGTMVDGNSGAQNGPVGTPLLIAVQYHHADIAKLLLEHGAKPDISDPVRGFTPLALADGPLAQLLLDHGADPNYHDPKGPTALSTAVRWKNEGLISVLLAAKADPNKMDFEDASYEPPGRRNYTEPTAGFPPLCIAVKNRDESAVKELLAHGAKVELPAKSGATALDEAVVISPAMVRLLLDHGASPVRPPETITPLHRSVASAPPSEKASSEGSPGPLTRPFVPGVVPRPNVVKKQPNGTGPRRIIRTAASGENTPQQIPRPVITVITHGAGDSSQVKVQLEIWNLLLGKGAEINAKNSNRETPLHYAAKNKDLPLEALDWLIDRGADPDLKDSDGSTPLDYLSEGDREKIEQKHAPAK